MKRYIPIFVIFIAIGVLYFLGVYDLFSWELFEKNRKEIKDYVQVHYILAPLIFIGIYTVFVVFVFPAASFLSIVGGFLFVQPLSTLYVVFSATLGATILFMAAKTACRDVFNERGGKYIKKVEAGFQKHGAPYLLLLRLLPVFPFWLVNVVPAFIDIPLKVFIWTTFVGIIPGTFVFTQAGRGIDKIFESGGDLSVWALFNKEMIIAIVAILSVTLVISLIKWKMKDKINL